MGFNLIGSHGQLVVDSTGKTAKCLRITCFAMGWKNDSIKDFRMPDFDCFPRRVSIMFMTEAIRDVGMQSVNLVTLGSVVGNILNKTCP
jgi:hypothetical protein